MDDMTGDQREFAERISEQSAQMIMMAVMSADAQMQAELLGFARRFARQATALRRGFAMPDPDRER